MSEIKGWLPLGIIITVIFFISARPKINDMVKLCVILVGFILAMYIVFEQFVSISP